MSTPHITALRQTLLETLGDLRNREQPMDVDRARAVAQVASVLVDTARVEVDFIKATGQDTSQFLQAAQNALWAQGFTAFDVQVLAESVAKQDITPRFGCQHIGLGLYLCQTVFIHGQMVDVGIGSCGANKLQFGRLHQFVDLAE